MDKWLINDDGTYTVKLEVIDFDNLVQQRLVEAAKLIEEEGYEDSVDVWEALMVVIPYFSNPDQIKELAKWNTDPKWINIVAKHNGKN